MTLQLSATVLSLLSDAASALVCQVVAALQEAELHAVLKAIETRVLGPLPDGPGGLERLARLLEDSAGLKSYVQLLLLELLHTATRPGWPQWLRERHALSVIDLAGF